MQNKRKRSYPDETIVSLAEKLGRARFALEMAVRAIRASGMDGDTTVSVNGCTFTAGKILNMADEELESKND